MLLDDISFGDRVAENESEKLSKYFVKTAQWNSLLSGKTDIIFGAKGSGKSALYTLLISKANEFEQNQKTILLTAEKPTGTTVFADITNEPPTEESEFTTLWKIYICQLIVDWLIDLLQWVSGRDKSSIILHIPQ